MSETCSLGLFVNVSIPQHARTYDCPSQYEFMPILHRRHGQDKTLGLWSIIGNIWTVAYGGKD